MDGVLDEDPRLKLPEQYHDLAPAFSRKDAVSLPPRRPGINLEIDLQDGAKAPYRKHYPASSLDNDTIKKWLDTQLENGTIRRSSSASSLPVIMVRKPGGGLRVCIDYRALNTLTVKNRYPIPKINETLALLAGKRYFTKLDIIRAFNRIRIAEGYEWLTAFSTRYGQYECMVMLFGLCNAPAIF
jgi:hypothetical protein